MIRNRRWQTAKSPPETEVTSPQKFQARYPSHCVACGGDIAVSTPVEGVRVRLKKGGSLKWYVWHDQPACHQKALEALDRAAILPIEKVSSEQDELLAAFREEASQL